MVRSLLTPRFEQRNGCSRGPPTIRPGAVVKRGSDAPVSENGLDHPGIGTEICQFIAEGVAAAMQGQARRDFSIPLQPQDKGTKRLP